jgi:three-Cys-motif partner protein
MAAGKSRSIEIFLNFPVLDMNRNVLWNNPDKVSPDNKKRMNTFWGDDSWHSAAYTTENDLFGHEEKVDSLHVAQAFQKRLKDVAGFAHVPDPMPMRNSKGGIVYYLFFASAKPVAAGIVKDIFKKYREKGKV